MRHRDEQERDFTETGVGRAWARRSTIPSSSSSRSRAVSTLVGTPGNPSWSSENRFGPVSRSRMISNAQRPPTRSNARARPQNW